MSHSPIGQLRLQIDEPGVGTLWTEPLCFVDAHVLALVFARRGLVVAMHLNDRARHQMVEALWAAAQPEDLAMAVWVVGCACPKCAKQPAECRLLRVRPDQRPAPASAPVPALASPPQPAKVDFATSLIQKIAQFCGLPVHLLDFTQGKKQPQGGPHAAD